MARLYSNGFELNSTTTGVETGIANQTSGTGSVTITSSIVRSGSYAVRVASTSSGISVLRHQISASDNNGPFYWRMYIYITDLPATTAVLMEARNNIGTSNVLIQLTSSGTLTLRNSSFVDVGSPSAALSLNTWYRVELMVSSTNIEARLDGSTFASDLTGGTAINRAYFGVVNSVSSYEIFIDDVAINDSTGSYQNSWPGEGGLIALRPSAAGDANAWTRAGADSGANWSQTDEITPNDATDFVQSTTLNQEDMYNLSDSGLSGSDTINLVSFGSRHSTNGSSNNPTMTAQIKKASGGTIAQGTGIAPTISTYFTNQQSTMISPLTLYNDPDGSPWSNTTLDSMQAGFKITVDHSNTFRVSAVWVYVDFTEGSGDIELDADELTVPSVMSTLLLEEQPTLSAVGDLNSQPNLATATLSQDYVIASPVSLTSAPSLSTLALTEAATLSGSTSLVTQATLSTVTLAQANTLAVLGSLVTQPSLADTALIQQYALTLLGLTSQPTLSAIVLTPSDNLASADLVVQAALGTASLVQQHQLTTAALTVAPTLGTVTLSEAVTVVAASLTSSPALSTGSLTQASALTIASLTTQPTVSTVSLAAAYVLDVASLTVAATFGTVVVTPSYTLISSSLVSQPLMQEGELTQAYVLVIDALTSEAVLTALSLSQDSNHGTPLFTSRGDLYTPRSSPQSNPRAPLTTDRGALFTPRSPLTQ